MRLLGDTLLYPLALLQRRPVWLLSLFAALFGIGMACNLALAALGYDVNDMSGDAARIEAIFLAFVTWLVVGLLIACALQDLGEREAGPNAADAMTAVSLNFIVSIAIGGPFLVLGAFCFALANQTPHALRLPAAILVVSAVVFAFLYVLARFSFAGPYSLAIGRRKMWASWSMTRGRELALAGLYAALCLACLLIALIFSLVVSLVIYSLGEAGEAWAPVPLWLLVDLAASQALAAFLFLYFFAAQTFLFHRLAVRTSDLAPASD